MKPFLWSSTRSRRAPWCPRCTCTSERTSTATCSRAHGAQLGDDVVYAEAGDLVFKPRNQWHTFWNAGDTPCRLLEIISPAGFEHFFNELGEQMAAAKAVSVVAVSDLAGLGARYGHYFQPESIARLCRQHGLVYPA